MCQVTTFPNSGSFAYTVPAGATAITVECWGGGGAGGRAGSNSQNIATGGGGGGGAYARTTITSLNFQANAYTVNVAAAKAGSSTTSTSSTNNGNPSIFLLGAQELVKAMGGTGATGYFSNGAGNSSGGNGSVSGSIGSIVYAGGNGGTGNGTSSGAGGGGAGTAGPGGNASIGNAGTGTSQSGGNGAAGVTALAFGNNGNNYGGGGSGARSQGNTLRAGGNGAQGFIRITAITLSVSSTNVNCRGASTGSATVTASGGTEPYTYSWSPSGGNGATASNLAAGTYTVTVTDVNNAVATISVNITQPSAALAAAISSKTNVSCNDGSNGSATASASGGTAPYAYSWFPSGGAGTTISGLAAGTYVVTVTDAKSCTSSVTATITQPAALSVSISSTTNVSCNGGNNGSAAASASGGTSPYSYSWTGGETAASISGKSAGTYTVTVTDANGCIAATTATITEPELLAANISSITAVSCNGGSNGAATVDVSGGTTPYVFLWTGGGSANNISGKSAGSYTVTVTDAVGCSVSATAVISEPASPLSVTISSFTNVSCQSSSDGSATANASGGTSPYSYSWTGGGSDALLGGAGEGSFTVTVTDTNGCTATAVAHIGKRNPSSSVLTSSACDNYIWNGVNYNQSGSYTATGFTNADGCDSVAYLNLTISASTSNTTSASSCDNYTWSVNNMTYTQSGIYSVVSGCHTEILDLIVSSSTSNTTAVSVCDSYAWSVNNVTYTESGNYSFVNGCHTEYLNLTVEASTTSSISVSACDSYTWSVNGQTYSQGGSYTYVTGCQTNILNLIITASTSNTSTASVCDNYTWTLNNQIYTQSGVYSAVNGCHTEYLNLTVAVSTITSSIVTACDSYTWPVNNINYTQSGTYTSVSGCHTEILDLAITAATSNTSSASACGSYTWSVNNITYTESGTYSAVNGCHTEFLSLTIIPSTSNTTTISVCDSYTWAVNNVTYTESGIYSLVSGCYTEYLNLTVAVSTSATSNVTACDSYLWSSSGSTYTQSGSYTSVTGCETSVLHLTITISTSNTNNASACDSYTWAFNGATYTQSGNYSLVNGCHTEILNLAISTSTENTATASACDSYVWSLNGTIYTQSGNYTSVAGCATEILSLTITTSTSDTNVVSVCNSYIWPVNGTTYTQSGSYTSVNGCHTEYLNLTVTASATTANAGSDQSNCGSGSFTLAGNTPLNGTGTWTVVSGTATIVNPSSPASQITGVPSGTTAVLRWTISNSPCAASFDEVSLVNNPSPGTPNAGIDQTICQYTSANLASNTPAVGTAVWSIVSGPNTSTGQLSSTTTPNAIFTPSASGSYTLRWTFNSSGCPSASDDIIINVTVFATTTVSEVLSTSGSFTIPPDVTSITVEAWGAGGSGGSSSVNTRTGGGGGGAYVRSVLAVSPQQSFSYVVGTGGTSGAIPDAGGDSWFGSSTQLLAKGGNSVATNSTIGATGGTATASIGTIKFSGGNGANSATNGGGGGSSAGSAANGNNATNATGGTAPTGGGNGGNGLTSNTGAGNPGTAPGGGGGGVFSGNGGNANRTGGAGGTGLIRVSYLPTPYVTASQSTVCSGTSTTLTAFGGETYLWSNGATTQSITVSPSSTTTYSVTINNNCSVVRSITVNVLPVPTASITNLSGTTVLTCTQTAINLEAGGNGNYLWSTGSTASSISVITPNTYTLTVTGTNGCTSTQSLGITQNITAPTLTVGVTPGTTVCSGTAVTLTASGGASYLWSTGATTNSITEIPTATTNYTVTATGTNGCTSSATRNIIVNPLPVIAISGNTSGCGSVTLTASGGTSYLWSGGNTTNAATNTFTSSGTYALTATTAAGCSSSTTVDVTVLSRPVITSTTVNPVCNGLSTGSIDVTVTGGASPFTYLWSNGSTEEDIIGLSAGTYTITVTGANGCNTSSVATITQPTAVSATITATAVSCNGGNNGTATVTSSGGTAPRSILWSTGSTTASISNLTAGTYTVTVTDANGCSAVETTTVTEPALLQASSSATSISCNGGSGTVTVTATGGIIPYTGTGTFTRSAGSYSYTISDANGCLSTTSGTISQPALITETISVSACSTYTWPSNNITYTASGTYSTKLTAANGCDSIITLTLFIDNPQLPVLACYETAILNLQTCQWDVTGTQPAAPTGLACYETATFNTVTCQWDVTGTQPAAPTGLACYETATFNTTTCQWDVTGTQPAAPTGLACYETAIFNTATCQWVVSGTQPAAPTGLACYETATFNTTTCQWDVTGIQPARPTTACYEIATFNTTTCEWVVSGTQPAAPTGLACYETATFNTTTCQWDVTGTQPARPTTACYETATFNTATCQWDVTGTQPQQPTIACYETATFNTTTCQWDVTGTQPQQPTIACYETAIFNTATCQWDVTGTQPAAPIGLACYETAIFNTATCQWNVTGTQPQQPTLACYQTATFNTATCQWDVTGTQPQQPTIACYETATFNTATCQWDVTGTQPAAPTGLACYETATFNTATCQWDVTGTQPQQPTIACYETATFNTATCQWDVTGTQPAAPTGLACFETATFNTTTCQWDVTGTQSAAPTGLACYETASFNTTTCQWDVTGTQPAAPTGLACYETATFNTATCQWDVTGTQPAAPTGLACYETATFNATTCQWVVSGTQPAAPTGLACYETATFNTATCQWDVTGTQPQQPTIACYETAIFNTATCQWDVTGTQPQQPTIACYETATFNTATCQWDVTGTQPAAPTGLACYETATFNTVTCQWDVTGTQPQQPTIACYETALFNTATCQWDVTGTPNPAVITNIIACDNYTWNLTGLLYTSSGIYSYYSNCQDYILNLSVNESSSSTVSLSACDSIYWNGATYNQSGMYSVSLRNSAGCDSIAYLNLTITPSAFTTTVASACSSYIWSNNGQSYAASGIYTGLTNNCVTELLVLTISSSTPALPGRITQTLVDNSFGARVYRFSIPQVSNALGYSWSFTGTLGASATVDSGDINSDRVIRMKFSSNSASATGDSVRVSAYSACGSSPVSKSKLTNTAWVSLTDPVITATLLKGNDCDGRTVRYSVPVPPNSAGSVGFDWTIIGSGLGANAIFDSGTTRSSRVIIVKYPQPGPSNSTDSVRFRYVYNSGMAYGNHVRRLIGLGDVPQPAAAPVITATPIVRNVCGSRTVRYSVPQYTVTTTAPVTGYGWSFSGNLLHENEGSTFVIDSAASDGSGGFDLAASRVIVVRYLIDSARTDDSVRCAYLTDCGSGPTGRIIVPLTAPLKPNAAPVVTAIPLVLDICGNRVVRFSVPSLTSATAAAVTGYDWNLRGPGLHAAEGVTYIIDSATSDGAGGWVTSNARVIRVKYLSDFASSTLDSVTCAYVSSCGTGSVGRVRPVLSNLASPTPSSVTAAVIPDSARVCGGRTVRYSVPVNNKTATSPQVIGYDWSFTGPLHSGLGSSFVIDSMDAAGLSASRVIRVRYLDNSIAASSDSVRCAYITNCGTGKMVRLKVPLTSSLQRPAPSSLVGTVIASNICGNRVVRYTVATPAPSATAADFTGYGWQFTGNMLHSDSGNTYIIDSMNGNSLESSNVIFVKYISNAQRINDTVRCSYLTACGSGPFVKAVVTLTTATPQPAAPVVSATTLVSNVCGNRRVRYSVPVTPAISSAAVVATGYSWQFTGGVLHASSGVTFMIDSINGSSLESSNIVIVKYMSNSARGNDTVRCAYTSACGSGSAGKVIAPLINPLLPPAAPAATTITQTLVKDSCGARYFRYSVPAVLPAATTTSAAANGYLWTMPFGSVGSTGVLDSGSLGGRAIVIRYSSNSAAGSGDSLRFQYTSNCGNGAARSVRLISTLLSPPLTPSGITITPVNTSACNARIYRYTAPALTPYSTTRNSNISYSAAKGYLWSFTGNLGANAVIDSGDASSRTILVRYTSNSASSAGDSVRVSFISDCGSSANYSARITNEPLVAPVPASITMQLISQNCEGSVYRYLAPALTQATSNTMAATGYSWQMPVGPLGSLGILDSGSLSGGIIIIRYTLNVSAGNQDIISVSYLTDCGPGPLKSEKISNRRVNGCPSLAKIESNPFLESGVLDAKIFPNPSYDQFKLQISSPQSKLSEARVYDLQGRLITKLQVMPGQVLNFGSSLKPGAYLVEVIHGNMKKTYRILKY